MTVAVAVARADDDRPRWPRRRGARRGGQIAVTGRRVGAPAAAAPAAGGGGDGRAFQGLEPRVVAARGGAAWGQGGGARGRHGGGGGIAAAPAPGAGRGRGGGAGCFGGGAGEYGEGRRDEGGHDAGEHRTGPPVKLREDAIDWLMGNVNTMGESSGGAASFADHYPDMNMRPLPKQKIHPPPNFLPFSEQEHFENNLDPQGTEIDGLNNGLALLYESIAVVRRHTYEKMCNISEANDMSSYGKEIGEESKQADMLIMNAEDIISQIKDLGGEALPIPNQFYVGIKPLKL